MRMLPSHLVTVFVTFSHIENEIVKEKRQIVISRWGAVLAGNRFFQEIISGGKRVPGTAPISHIVAPKLILSFG